MNEIENLKQKLQRIKQIIEEYDPKFIAKCKAGPPSDYSNLWCLTKEFREKLRKELEIIQ